MSFLAPRPVKDRNIIEAKVIFRSSRKVDKDQEWILKNGAIDMLHKVSPALHSLEQERRRMSATSRRRTRGS